MLWLLQPSGSADRGVEVVWGGGVGGELGGVGKLIVGLAVANPNDGQRYTHVLGLGESLHGVLVSGVGRARRDEDDTDRCVGGRLRFRIGDSRADGLAGLWLTCLLYTSDAADDSTEV